MSVRDTQLFPRDNLGWFLSAFCSLEIVELESIKTAVKRQQKLHNQNVSKALFKQNMLLVIFTLSPAPPSPPPQLYWQEGYLISKNSFKMTQLARKGLHHQRASKACRKRSLWWCCLCSKEASWMRNLWHFCSLRSSDWHVKQNSAQFA